MSKEEYQLLSIVKILDEANAILQQHEVSKCRISNLSNCTKYLYRCKQYREYPFCWYEIQAFIPDNNPSTIKITFKNAHDHAKRNTTSLLSSPIHESIEKYVKGNLSLSQIKAALSLHYPTASLPAHQILNSTTYVRGKNNPEIILIYDFSRWCMNYKYDDNLLHSTCVSHYSINNVNGIFVFFTTKQLIQKIRYTS